MLVHGDGLLDEAVQVLGQLGGKAGSLEDAEHLGVGDALHLGDTAGITQDDA